MTDQGVVESIDDEDSVTSSNINIQDLINHVRCLTESDTHPYLENAAHSRQESHSEIDSLLT